MTRNHKHTIYDTSGFHFGYTIPSYFIFLSSFFFLLFFCFCLLMVFLSNQENIHTISGQFACVRVSFVFSLFYLYIHLFKPQCFFYECSSLLQVNKLNLNKSFSSSRVSSVDRNRNISLMKTKQNRYDLLSIEILNLKQSNILWIS